MNLKQILEYRRATRHYTSEPIATEKVRECLELATLTPTSSNMQMYEMVHITDKSVLEQVAKACLSQGAATTAQQIVVFVTRQDKYRQRAKTLLEYEKENVRRNSPKDRWEHRMKRWETYYGKYIPFVYARFFGLVGFLRKILAFGIGLFRPIVHEVSENDRRVSVHQSCGMVAQTFMLAMAEQGYDTCPLGGFDSRRLKKILRLPSGAEINMVVSCGIRDKKGIWGDRFRVPFEEVYRGI
ncbi:nitroreductase family protein [Capnocytophaga sp.]|uniref:nitroreductase family protein n=1 Tax=Capnocytophaga sp. TaxID=44737 RepID=UPI0026DC611C|nr:nitroreductase family protein [Capnocytophaga sp.]MDO5105178.1 nitroreductase family protein [Capnocytophaga sp.]